MKNLFTVLALVLAFLGGIWISNTSLMPKLPRKEEISTQVLLERIEEVTKLVTVEGHISEIYDYKDYYGYDWSIFRKKALIRVTAKVSAGYDLSQLAIEVEEEDKTVTLGGIPSPQILSIDHNLDYYDLREGTFNTFSKDDLNRLNQQAKVYVEEIAKDSEILEESASRGQEMLDMIRFLVEGSGYTLQIRPTVSEPTSTLN